MLLRSTHPGATKLRSSPRCFQRGLATRLERVHGSESRPHDFSLQQRPGKRNEGHSPDFAGGKEDPSHRQRVIVGNGQKKLLTPYVLSQRVKAFCKKGDHNQAIRVVKEAPLDAQNAVVWASLINEVIAAGRYNEAYRLFTEMKRRGIRPTTRTYGTLLDGYTQIEDWDRYPLQLDNVCSIYDQLRRHHADIQRNGRSEGELSNIPYNQLIAIFGKSQRFQRMYDVFNGMPTKGPLAPDMRTFTVLINAIGNRDLSALPHSSPSPEEEEESVPPSHTELVYKNASDAKLIWRQLLRVCHVPDSHAIRAILKPLSRGRPSDQNLALDIVHEYLGLSRPGEQAIPAKVPLHALTLESILHTCNKSRRYRFTLHYIQQVTDSDRAVLLNRKHMDLAMEAHAALALTDPGESKQALEMLQWMLRMYALPPGPDGGIGPQIKPKESTYDLVAIACWRSGDWRSACRTFTLMAGHDSDQFRGETPEPIPPRRGFTLKPSARFMSSFIRTAAKTYDPENIRQVLNIFEHYGWDHFFDTHHSVTAKSTKGAQKHENDWAFYTSKLAQTLTDALPDMLKSYNFDDATRARWRILLGRANEQLTKQGKVVSEIEV